MNASPFQFPFAPAAGNSPNFATKNVIDPRWGPLAIEDRSRPLPADTTGARAFAARNLAFASRTGAMPAFGQPAPQQDMGGGGSFGMGKPTQGPVDAHIGAPDPFAPDPNWDPTGTPYAPDKRKAGQFAGGGMVEGPGGPKDDLIPAKLSDGEFVMPAEAVKFFGLDKLHKMTQKAREGLMEIPDGANQPGTGNPEPGTAPMPHMACGGPVKKYAAGGFVNPYADDPVAYAQRQQEAMQAPLMADGITDQGGGMKTLNNRYGTGFATVPGGPGFQSSPARFNDAGNSMTATPGQGLAPVPDIIPSGPWAAPALPFDAAANRQNIAAVTQQMQPGAPVRLQADLMNGATQAALIPKGRAMITVPDATWKPAAASSPATFQAPWEKDAAARELRDQALIPGMNRTESRRFLKTPQGVEFASKQQQQNQPWVPIPGSDYLRGPGNNVVPKSRGNLPGVTPEQAAALGMKPASIDTTGKVTYKAAGEGLPSGGRVVMSGKSPVILHPDGTFENATNLDSYSDADKSAAFEAKYGRKPDAKSESDWSEAWYLARAKRLAKTEGQATPAAAASQPGTGNREPGTAPAPVKSRIQSAVSKFSL